MKKLVAGLITLWDLDVRAPSRARRSPYPGHRSAQVHLESAWRRQQVRHRRARQLAWRATLQLARNPHAWAAQGAEILVSLLKLLSTFWGANVSVLFLWCVATSTPFTGVSAEGKALSAALVSLWLATCVAWSIYRLRLPVGSPFVEIWYRTYDDAVTRTGRRGPK